MKVKEIHELAIKEGIKADPRGKDGVKDWLNLQKKQYEQLPKIQQKSFDRERLTNPYMDTRINFDSGKPVRKIMIGIDITTAEVLLADKLDIDLIIAHHPEGNALANLDEVMHLQADLLNALVDMPINVGENLLKKEPSRLIERLLLVITTKQWMPPDY